MNNGEYYFAKLEERKLSRGDGVAYCYVSPETRDDMTTASGAALLPDEWDWKRVEERVATAFFNFPLYNPTTEDVTPVREESRYDRFFEMAIKAKLYTERDKYRRVYDALGVSFKPADRNNLHRVVGDIYGETNSTDTDFGKTVGTTVTPSGQRTTKTVTDSGTVGTGESVSTGNLSTQTNAQTAFDTNSFANTDKSTTSVDTPARTVANVTESSGTYKTETNVTDGGDEHVDGAKDYTLDRTEDVTGWTAYDIETSVAANLEIAKTTISKMIVDDIVEAIICGVYDERRGKANIPDFIMEQILWGEYDEQAWNTLTSTWKGASFREIYD